MQREFQDQSFFPSRQGKDLQNGVTQVGRLEGGQTQVQPAGLDARQVEDVGEQLA